jgi:hypothetical protein
MGKLSTHHPFQTFIALYLYETSRMSKTFRPNVPLTLKYKTV